MKLLHSKQTPGPSCSSLVLGICLAISWFHSSARGEEQVVAVTNQAPVIQLRGAVKVDGEGVFLSQLVESPLDLPRLHLCDAPQFGKSIVLKRAEVAELARAAGFEEMATNWSGPGAVSVTRRSRSLPENEALQRLTSLLQKQFIKAQGDLELHLTQPMASINVPDEAFELKILDLPTSGVSSAFIVRFEIETAHHESIGSWQASLQAKVWREIWVAASTMKRGDPVRSTDLGRQRRDMLLCWEPLAEFSPDDPSLEFVGPVQAGTPIWARFIRQKAVVHRGQTLAAVVEDGALQITLKVEALEDGAAGQIIRIRNPFSQRNLRGKVIDEQNVLVSM